MNNEEHSSDAPVASSFKGSQVLWLQGVRIEKSDREALCQVFAEETVDALWCYLRHFCQMRNYTPEEFEDLRQDILLEFVRIRQREDAPENEVPYLKRVMCNIAKEYQRRRTRERERFEVRSFETVEELEDFVEEFGRLKDSEAGPQIFELVAQTLDLQTLLKALPPEFQAFARDLSREEVYTALKRHKISKSVYYARIRNLLREALAPYVVLD